jgi:hypothetical protein
MKEMNGNSIVLDSNIIIYLSRDKVSIDDLIKPDLCYSISVITYMEVLGYNFDTVEELETIRALLGFFKIVYIDEKISQKVIEIRAKNRLKLPDAIICATAIVHNAILYSNDKNLNKLADLKTEFIEVQE